MLLTIPRAEPDSAPQPFHVLLRSARTLAGMGQRELAGAARLDPATINRMERSSAHRPRLDTVVRLIKALDLPLNSLAAQELLVAAGTPQADVEGLVPGARDVRATVDLLTAKLRELEAKVEKLQLIVLVDGLASSSGDTPVHRPEPPSQLDRPNRRSFSFTSGFTQQPRFTQDGSSRIEEERTRGAGV